MIAVNAFRSKPVDTSSGTRSSSSNRRRENNNREKGPYKGEICKRCEAAGLQDITHSDEKCWHNEKNAGERPIWFKNRVKTQKGNDDAADGSEGKKVIISAMARFKQPKENTPRFTVAKATWNLAQS
jgi:hypothetical protein